MKDLPIHLALFALVGLAIVTIACLFGEQEDRPALSVLPRRYLYYLFGCAMVAAVMLACEELFA